MNLRFRQLTAFLCLVCHLATTVLAQSPAWWSSRGVIVSGQQADDFAAMNIGQLKTFARGAWLEMEAKLTGGAGDALDQLIQNWDAQASPADDYAVATLGQLKTVARPFYQRLQTSGIATDLPAWLAVVPSSDDFSVANIGQAKTVFRFEIVSMAVPSTAQSGTTSTTSGTSSGSAGSAGAGGTANANPTGAAPTGDGATTSAFPAPAPAATTSVTYPDGFRLATAVRTKTISIQVSPVYPMVDRYGQIPPSKILRPYPLVKSHDPRSNISSTDGDALYDDGLDANGDGDPDDPGDPRDLEPGRDDVLDDGKDFDGDGDVDDGEQYQYVEEGFYPSEGEGYYREADTEASPISYVGKLRVQNFTLRPSYPEQSLTSLATVGIPWLEVIGRGINHPFHGEKIDEPDNTNGWQWDKVIRGWTTESKLGQPEIGSGATLTDAEVALWCSAPAPEEQRATFLVIDTKTPFYGPPESALLGSITLIIPQGREVARSYEVQANNLYRQTLAACIATYNGSGNKALMGKPGGGIVIHLRPPTGPDGGAQPFTPGPGDTITRQLIPFNLSVEPAATSVANDTTVVAADEESGEVPAHLFIDSPGIVKADIWWSTEGGTLSSTQSTFEHDDWDVATNLGINRRAGSTHTVTAKLRQLYFGNPYTGEISPDLTINCLNANITVDSQTIVTGPGAAASVAFSGDTEMPADGITEKEITATVSDAHNNLVAEGTQVSWHLEGDGEIVTKSLETDANGQVKAKVRAGRIPGEDQTLVLYADGTRQVHTIENTALNINLSAGAFSAVAGSTTKKQFKVTATAAGAAGTPVRWQTTRGKFISKSSNLQGGLATATVEIDTANGGGIGRVVVTAAIAKSMGITSVKLPATGLELRPVSPILSKDLVSLIDVIAPLELAGKNVVVTAEPPLKTVSLLRKPPGNMTTFPFQEYHYLNTKRLDYDFAATVDFAWPSTWWTNGGTSDFELMYLGNSTLRVNNNGATLMGNLAVPDPFNPGEWRGESVRLSVVVPGGGFLARDNKKRRCEVLYEDKQLTLRLTDLSKAPAAIHTASAKCAGRFWMPSPVPMRANPIGFNPISYTNPAVHTYWRPSQTGKYPATPADTFIQQVNFTWEQDDVNSEPLRISGTSKGQVITLDATGKGQFSILAPQGYLSPTATLTARLQEQTTPAIATATTSIPVVQPGSNLLAKLAELHTNVHFDNRTDGDATAEEKTELARFAASVTATPEAVIAAAPAESGGDLEHQVQEGKKLIDLAKDLDAVTAKIYDIKKQLDTITTRDAAGRETKLVTLFNLSDLLRPLINPVGTLSTALGTLNTQHGKTITDLSTATAQNLVALTRTMRGTDTWKRFLAVSEKAGAGVFMKDLDHWVGAVSEEGAAEMILALSRFFAAGVQNPQALATVGASTLDSKLGPWLNSRATTPGSKVAAASVGLLSQMVQSTAMLAALTADPDGLKRMLGQLMGTVLSAFSGSEAARAELEEMVPFWSWITMGEDTARLWTKGNYYGCGKRACELLVQAVGDVTIFVPVIKGVAMAVQAGSRVSIRMVQRVIKQASGKFARNTIKETDDALMNRVAKWCIDRLNCFPAGTLVLMADRTLKPIQFVKRGDLVLADNPEDTAPPEARMVLQTPVGLTQHLVLLHLDQDGDRRPDATLRATRAHPFWTVNAGWTQAFDLQPGDQCLTAQGSAATITSTEVVANACTTYNLTVDSLNTYFVQQGGCSVLVHNTAMEVSRQWVVYAMQIPGPNDTVKLYIGRASMPAVTDLLESPIPEASRSVFNYRSGPDGKNHHVWKKFGSQFVPPGDTSKVKFAILDSYWASPGDTPAQTTANNKAAKERCMAIERRVSDAMTDDWEHPENLLNKNRPLSRNPRESVILASTPKNSPAVRKSILQVQVCK